jgi:hypothetical protein
MNDLMKSAIVTLLSAAAVLCPRTSPAMTIEMFDDLAAEDQRDYVNFLVKGSQKILIEEGRQDLADKVEELFRKPRGARQSSGEAHFQKGLVRFREYLVQQAETIARLHVTSWIGQIEDVFVQTLVSNGIQPPHRFSKSLGQLSKTFWPKRPLRTASVS